MFDKITSLVTYFRIFEDFNSIRNFRKIRWTEWPDEVVVNARESSCKGLTIRPNTTDALVFWATFFHKYHLPTNVIGENPVIFDLGANVGFTVSHFAKLYPNSRIIAVELDKTNFEQAERNLKNVRQCRLINAAVWFEDGEIKYALDERQDGFHVDLNTMAQKVAVAPALSMATIMRKTNVDRIDYVKMDIEGAEFNVLSTNNDWLQKVQALNVELHPQFSENATFENCSAILSEFGFSCQRHASHHNGLIAFKS